jgi:hypothetical protein
MNANAGVMFLWGDTAVTRPIDPGQAIDNVCSWLYNICSKLPTVAAQQRSQDTANNLASYRAAERPCGALGHGFYQAVSPPAAGGA